MDRTGNEFRDRLEKQCVNDHRKVQIRPQWKKKLMLEGLLCELTLMWISLWLIIRK